MDTAMVDVVLPCFNEAAALPWVLKRMPPGYRAIVVDNGSTDDSAAVALAHGAFVVTEPRRGFGAAAHAGLCAAEADLVAFLDADASLDPAELPILTAIVASGRADLALGRRRVAAQGAWPWHARVANRWLAARAGSRAGVVLHDLGPMRVAPRVDLLALDVRDRRSGYPLELVLRAAARSWRIAERDVSYRPRIGRSKVTGTVRGTITAIGDMTRVLAEGRRT